MHGIEFEGNFLATDNLQLSCNSWASSRRNTQITVISVLSVV